jgi:hypothetical protein
MYYILDKLGRIVGWVDGPVDADDLASRGESLVESELSLPLDMVEVVGFPSNPAIVEKKELPPSPKLELSTTAKDTDGDGLPELPANGKSKTSITATLRSAEGEVLDQPVTVLFRTSAGALSHRSVTAAKGKAKVSLTSSLETVEANVTASAEGFEPANLVLEFVPPGK